MRCCGVCGHATPQLCAWPGIGALIEFRCPACCKHELCKPRKDH